MHSYFKQHAFDMLKIDNIYLENYKMVRLSQIRYWRVKEIREEDWRECKKEIRSTRRLAKEWFLRFLLTVCSVRDCQVAWLYRYISLLMIKYMIFLTVYKLPVNKTNTNINIDQLIYACCLLNLNFKIK